MPSLTLDSVHTAALLACLLAACAVVVWRKQLVRTLRDFFLELGSPWALGALRVVVFSHLSGQLGEAAAIVARPSAIRELPYGWGWLRDVVPFDPAVASAAELTLFVTSACAVVGLLTRVTAPLAAVLAVYVLGLPNFYLKIDHSSQVIVLSALIVSVSPCADALSVDALYRRFRGVAVPGPSLAYALPIRFCWLLLGTAYLFPGVWKLWDTGDLWISGVQLQSLLYLAWGRGSIEPLARIDQVPWLLSFFGTATLVFEIGFIFAIFWRPSRVVAAFSAVLFHWGVFQMMGIRIHTRFPLILLIDLPGLPDALGRWFPSWAPRLAAVQAELSRRAQGVAARLRLPEAVRTVPRRALAPAVVVGSLLFGGQVLAGAAQVDSWPISVYPRFTVRRPEPTTRANRTRVMLVHEDGTEQDLVDTLEGLGGGRLTRLMLRIQKVDRNYRVLAEESRTLIRLFRSNGADIDAGDRIEIRKETWSIFPLSNKANFRSRTLGSYEVTANDKLKKVAPQQP